MGRTASATHNPAKRLRRGTSSNARPSALRHFYASWIIEQALIPERVQELMGHSSMQMTDHTCGHLFPTPEECPTKLARAEASLAAWRRR